MNLHIKTPLLESFPLSNLLGIPVFLKMEALQPSGSFKNRGIGYICTTHAKQGSKAFVCSSGGNAGLAAAYSGRKLQIPVTIVVPKTTLPLMIEKIRLEGAKVIIHGDCWDEADRYAKTLLNEQTTYIPPFDHPLIWKGHSTLIDELHEKPGAIVTAVGGGGLFCGILEGLHRVGWHDVPVIAVETKGSSSLASSMQAGKIMELKEVNTIATSLAAKKVCNAAFEWTQKHTIYPELVTDLSAVDAVMRFADDHRILVEPACGAALSLIYQQLPLLKQFSSVVVIVCGGAGVTRKMLTLWQEKFKGGRDEILAS
ncbi:MAG: pyridoxal-phosphate dependent enzyme [Chlamydiae bacterium]|nr:pyridoxal-phosphate dependent enzyme [Chlamydiota bacterium]